MRSVFFSVPYANDIRFNKCKALTLRIVLFWWKTKTQKLAVESSCYEIFLVASTQISTERNHTNGL